MDSALDKRGNHHSNPKSEREKALADYTAYLKEGTFLPEASYLAFGTCKQALTLDAIALDALSQKKLPQKALEKALLRLALYELYYMDAPRYAVGQEWVKIAKKKTHPAFAGFMNALIRNLPETRPCFDDLSVEYSYPKALVDELLSLFPKETVIRILQQGNLPAETQARIRPGFEVKTLAKDEIAGAIADPNLYVMNRTPAELIKTLAARIPPPETILDLCAAPGGKLVALHDLFPRAALYANDVSSAKLDKVRENLALYGLSAHLTEGKGEEYPETQKFDLVVLDVPCSNTGVFSKHPEARFRISELEPLQKALLAKAKRLVKPNGAIFYLTCSILKREHPECDKAFEMEILPTEPGTDGGYGAIILAN